MEIRWYLVYLAQSALAWAVSARLVIQPSWACAKWCDAGQEVAMSDLLFGVPDAVAAAAGDLGNIGSTISQANTAAAFPTTGSVAAGADDVSLGVAQLFGAHAQDYQALSAQLEAFHQDFVQTLTAAPAHTPTPKPPAPKRWGIRGSPGSKVCSMRATGPPHSCRARAAPAA